MIYQNFSKEQIRFDRCAKCFCVCASCQKQKGGRGEIFGGCTQLWWNLLWSRPLETRFEIRRMWKVFNREGSMADKLIDPGKLRSIWNISLYFRWVGGDFYQEKFKMKKGFFWKNWSLPETDRWWLWSTGYEHHFEASQYSWKIGLVLHILPRSWGCFEWRKCHLFVYMQTTCSWRGSED